MFPWGLRVLILCGVAAFAQQQTPVTQAPEATPVAAETSDEDANEPAEVSEPEATATQNRTSLNLLGQTNAQGG